MDVAPGGNGADRESGGDDTKADEVEDAPAGGHRGDDSDVTPEEGLRLEHATVINTALVRRQLAAIDITNTREEQSEELSCRSREAGARTSPATELGTVWGFGGRGHGGGSGGGGGDGDDAAAALGTGTSDTTLEDVLAADVADAVSLQASCV